MVALIGVGGCGANEQTIEYPAPNIAGRTLRR
jgi:hypothetical protein